MIYDRIDLVATGSWYKNFRPNGVTISFGDNLDCGDIHASLTDVTLPFGAVVGASEITLSTATAAAAGGIVTASGVYFASVSNVLIPYGVKFTAAQTIGGISYPAGTFKSGCAWTMNTIQLVDINSKAIFSVHGTDSDEQIAFTRPTADIRRLVMYKEGMGIDVPVFACYGIVFKSTLTLTDITNFAKLHPSDLNPVIVDDGTAKNSSYIISAV